MRRFSFLPWIQAAIFLSPTPTHLGRGGNTHFFFVTCAPGNDDGTSTLAQQQQQQQQQPPPLLRRSIPDKVLIGYAHNSYDKVREAVANDGVNVVIWSFMEIVASSSVVGGNGAGGAQDGDDGMPLSSSSRQRALLLLSSELDDEIPIIISSPQVRTGLELDNIAALIEDLDADGHSNVLHLASFGGWNGNHLDPSLDAHGWYSGWTNSPASDIFHGIDWDLEGHDDRSHPNNVFSIDCLDKMGEIGRLLKEDGYVVSMAPPQSYLDFDSSDFSRYVNLTHPQNSGGWHADFGYFGSNVYAYVLAKYGDYVDLISVQLYESYSDAAMAVHNRDGVDAGDYLYSFVRNLAIVQNQSYYVDFSLDPSVGMPGMRVGVPLSKLVIGLANGWALEEDDDGSSENHPDNGKNFYASPDDCRSAYARLLLGDDDDPEHNGDLTPRGFMFWTIEERGMHGVYLAEGIGEFLHTT